MPSNESKLTKLKGLSYELAELYAAAQPGEGWHPEYKKNRDNFRKLIRTNIKLERKFRAYFKDLAKRVTSRISWSDYNNRLYKADEFFLDDGWEDELLEIRVNLDQILFDAFMMGAFAQEAELGFSSGFVPGDQIAQEALRRHVLRLSGQINETTIKQIKQSLISSIQQGLNQFEAGQRLEKLVSNPYRARMISHTETVRAYTQGRLEIGIRIGAKEKQWFDGQPGACKVCSALNGMVVGIDEQFPTLIGPRDGSPAHPWCKCLTKIIL